MSGETIGPDRRDQIPIPPGLEWDVNGNQYDVVAWRERVSSVSGSGYGLKVYLGDSPAIDAFGRFRVSNPETLFDSKNIFDDPDLAGTVENQPLFYDNAEISGSGTGTAYNANQSSQSLSVSANTAGSRVRQSRMRFNYQPGKSQLIMSTFVIGNPVSGVTKREGLFDEKNGIFIEVSDDAYICKRTYTSGSAVDTKIAQADWNIDPMDGTGDSGIDLDFTKTHIMFVDFAWLGVSRVRIGFVVDGVPFYAHQFLHANILDKVYMQTPNLPIRTEITNDGTGAADSITQICSTVISEGGSTELGSLRYASTAGTHVATVTENVIYAVLGIRLKSAYLGASIKIINAALQIHTASAELEWLLLFNPTVTGTFTYADQSQSAVQIARGTGSPTVTNGYAIAGGYIESGGVSSGANGGLASGIDNAIRLGSLINGTADTIVLAVRPIAGSTAVDVEGSLTWRELL